MRILHILSQRPDSTGSGITVRAVIREAVAHGHDNMLIAGVQTDRPAAVPDLPPERVRVVGFRGPGDAPARKPPDTAEPIPEVGFRLPGMSDVMPYSSSRFGALSPVQIQQYEAAFRGVIADAIRAFKPDVIHTHHLWLVTALARRIVADIPMVTSCHGSDIRQFRNCPHLRERVLLGCRKVDAVLALSRVQKEEIIELYGFDTDTVHVTGAGYNDILFRWTEKSAAEPVRLVYAGKLSRAKGVPWLLKVLDEIEAPAWTLDLVGGGTGTECDECMVRAASMAPRVTLHGALSQSDLATIMKRCHVLILPSFFEGLPLVIIEGLACGCRIVATDLPGVRELVADLPESVVLRVSMPRLHASDQPRSDDIPVFLKHLDRGMRRMMHTVRESPDIQDTRVHRILAGHTWSGVFKRILKVYRRVAG